MAASSICDSLSVSNITLLSARCTGFAKVKGQNDYAFIIDLDWSDDRSMSIKRTYTQFQHFHTNLIKLFPELKQTIKSKLRLQTSLKENMASLFAKDKRGLAESREQMLDFYLVNLLRQPERIRKSNVVLSFFEPRESDPKPCKSSSPNEKSDSGIDLTSDRKPQSPVRPRTCDMGVQHEGDFLNQQSNTDEEYLNEHCGVDTCVKPPAPWRDAYDSESNDDYDGDTSGTETDNDPFDEDYLLDVGFAELMLQSTDDLHLELSRTSSDSSTWCSNLNKFSNILNTLPSVDNVSKQYVINSSLYNLSDDEYDEITKGAELSEPKENSDTESQMVTADHLSDGLESDDEFMCKPVAQTDMNHYYLSTTTEGVVE